MIVAEHLGGDSFYVGEIEGVGEMTVRAPGDHSARAGDVLHLRARRDNIHLFDKDEHCITRSGTA